MLRPRVLFHGLGTSCDEEMKVFEMDGFFCVESGAGMRSAWLSIDEQADVACDYLRSIRKVLANGFHILAFSQGGLIARDMMHRCRDIGELVRRIVFVGTPHLGISRVPSSEDFHPQVWTQEEIEATLEYYKEMLDGMEPEQREATIAKVRAKDKVESRDGDTLLDVGAAIANWFGESLSFINLAPMNYFNPEYGYSELIHKLNSPKYDFIYDNLELVVCVTNHDERVISPAESTILGFTMLKEGVDRRYNSSNSPFFKSMTSGLGGLWMNKRLVICGSDTSHAKLAKAERESIITLFDEIDNPNDDFLESAKNVKKRFLGSYGEKCEVKTKKGIFDPTEPKVKFFI